MNSKIKEVIVMDSESIFVVSINEGATRDDVLAAYMRVSGEGWRTRDGMSYVYWTTTHSPMLYSIRRKIKKPEEMWGLLLGDIDIADGWANAYPVIEQIANVTTALIGVATVTSAPFLFVKWIRSKNINKEKDKYNPWERGNKEYAWVYNILRNDNWNVSLLSQELSISEEETKKLLKGFGYVWDSHKMLYIATENTEKLRNIKPDENYS